MIFMKNDIANNDIVHTSTQQSVTGSSHRVAGRDYIEHLNVTDIDFILMTEPKDNLDARAIVNERFFNYRFKFHANKVVREKLINFQNTLELTDVEIKTLYSVGLIHPKYNELTIKSSRSVFYLGWIFTAIITLYFLLLIYAFVCSSHQTGLAGITVLSSALIYVGVMWLIDKRCLQPSRLLRNKQIYQPITL